ncbi:MAG: response regulator [Lachnospiraceae bacterium]|nr:response regulator [Lachnospiraceae bacterium]
MKGRTLRKIILYICLVIIVAGSFSYVPVMGADPDITGETDPDHQVGGGYAASAQIPGVYYLPVVYDQSNGLPASEIYSILAARNGYIWIGGHSGIIRYDGVSFEKIPSTDGLTSGRYRFEDSRGNIWVATNDSGVVVLGEKQRWHYTKEDGLNSDSIRSFAEDARGNVFISSTAGVSYVDPYMNLHRIDDERINNERILRLVSDVNGVVYGHTGSGAVFTVLTAGIGDFRTSSDMNMEKVTTILADRSYPGRLYFGTESNRVYYGRFGDTADKMMMIETGSVSDIHWMHYACSRLWISSTQYAGYVDVNKRFVMFESLPIKDSIEMMTSDHQGNMWYASSRYGVMKIAADNFLDMSGASGLDPEVVNATCKRRRNLYVGTDKGVRIINEDYYTKTNYITEFFKDTRVRCIMNDKKGNTWFSAYTNELGLVCLDIGGSLIQYTTEDGLPSNAIRCTGEMNDGTVIVGTSEGIALVKDGKVTDTYGAAEGLKNPVIVTVCEGENGEIYAGSDGDGIYVIKNGRVSRLGKENGLGSDVLMRIKRDPERRLIWVLTSNSVEYIKDGKIVKVTTLPHMDNIDVIPAKDKLWFLSSQGIYVVNALDAVNDRIVSYKLFDRTNGLTSMPISYCYSGYDENGDLYIAGQTGVSVINVNELYDLSGKNLVGVRSVFYDGEEILPAEDGSYTLPPKGGRIQINAAVFDYTISNPLIRLYLEGMDDEGITAYQSELPPLEYTAIKYGDHPLHIQILDSMTKKVISDHVIPITKTPGIFERLSVRIVLMVFMLMAIGIIVWRITTSSIIRKQYVQIQEAKNEAERANLAKTRFLANMSHEIRVPINTIMGMDELILREENKNVPREYRSAIAGYARNIRYASENLLNIINDLFDISGIETGKIRLIEEEYDSSEMLRSVISVVRSHAEEKKLYFNLEIDKRLPKRLYGDSGKIKQILLILLSNAVKYTDEGGFVLSVKVAKKNDAGVELEMSVKDTGIGVRSEDTDKLFHAYERMEEVVDPEAGKTGLGLDISRQLTELMGGKIRCESIYGEGSEFIFTVKQKIVDPAETGEFSEEGDEAEAASYKPAFVAPDADILVVDDNAVNLNIIRGLLKATKVFVTTAGSGEECLEKIAGSDFNVVLLDHLMPGLDGEQTIRKIRETHPDLPVYALSSGTAEGRDEYFRSIGFTGYLNKPVDVKILEKTILKHLPSRMVSEVNRNA